MWNNFLCWTGGVAVLVLLFLCFVVVADPIALCPLVRSNCVQSPVQSAGAQ